VYRCKQKVRGRPSSLIGHYSAVQRLLYLGVIGALVLQVVTGLAIWKPVQLGTLVGLFGGYPIARNIHLATMFLIANPHQARFQDRKEAADDRSDSYFPGRILGKSGLRLVFRRLTVGCAVRECETRLGLVCPPVT
jgi:hypothetical protein